MIKKEGISESTNVQSELKSILLEFKGTGGEYFKIWIVNIFLSVLTMGIFSAWAKVRTNRYFYHNSRLDKSGFEYHATPITILKGRLATVCLLLIFGILSKVSPLAGIVFAMLIFLGMPWIIWRNIRFNAGMTSYRNVRFAFDGPLETVYRYMLLLPLLPVFATTGIGIIVWLLSVHVEMSVISILIVIGIIGFYIVIPSVQQLITAYTISNYRYGQSKFRANLSMKIFYMTYLSVIAWSFVFILLIGVLVSIIVSISGINMQAFSRLSEWEILSSDFGLLVTFITQLYLGLILLGIWFKAYIKTRLRNHTFDQIQLDSLLKLHSNMKVSRLFWFYVINFVLMVVTLGLAYPWVKVRIARFTLDSIQVLCQGRMDRYVTEQLIKQSVLGEELGETFDDDTAAEITY
jgi:uncharacterized membrane protein YjgN (DUF898 family)